MLVRSGLPRSPDDGLALARREAVMQVRRIPRRRYVSDVAWFHEVSKDSSGPGDEGFSCLVAAPKALPASGLPLRDGSGGVYCAVYRDVAEGRGTWPAGLVPDPGLAHGEVVVSAGKQAASLPLGSFPLFHDVPRGILWF